MPRTLLNADAAQLLANEIFEDGGALAVFNAVFEIQNGKLTAMDQGSDAADDDAVTLVGIIGHCQFNGDEFSYQETMEEAGEDAKAIVDLAVSAVKELPTGDVLGPETTTIDSSLPSTLAVMAVWRGPKGDYWTACSRHPMIAPEMAALILKDVVEEFSHDEDAAPAQPN